tara:strand:- start:1317 stop:1604 length:288 start_codon:yes stop_codon:yes gene_type:complete
MIYHLVSMIEWNDKGDQYSPASLKSEGFIHFSTKEQVDATYERFYKPQEMYLLEVDESILKHKLIYEEADGDSYPHLYGPLNLDAVVRVVNYPNA